MSGYVYGFVFGFVVAFTGAMAGSIVCFYFCRRWFKGQVRKLMAKNKSLKGVVRTVEKRGFRLLVLIRLAPYPFNVMNAVLSATHIPLSTYIVATAISLTKLALHVYIGSTLSTLTGGDGDDTDPEKDPNNHGKRVKVFIMVMGIILGIGVGAYVWIVAKREIAITEAARMERRQRRRRGGRRGGGGEGLSANGGDGGIELRDQHGGYIPDVDLTHGNSVDGLFSGAASGRGGEGQDLSDANHFVGGVGNESGRYQDYEDDGDDHEGNLLFGTGGQSQQQRQQQQHGEWRNVGAAGASAGLTDSSTDSDQSDYFDDSEDDSEEEGDLERGYGLGHDLNGDDRTGGRGGGGGGYGEGDGRFGEGEDEALDFSAHHAGLVDSPWQDDDEGGEDDRLNLLGGSEERGGNETRGR
ncbi:hypothetical protein EC957_005156 [Mortierella hygrophila]|uniref:Golgi apparatus membrane protein TVP38 n=1 Tax=Mortierella hygrophila TaxID=979708 RepID=A0A9P6JZE5_9FUNG|nr:hypothetical protein EC957_005156 [Mortierella hygrophila]